MFRFLLAVLLAVCLTSGVASGSTIHSARTSAWRTLVTHRLAFSFRYPATWTLVTGNPDATHTGQATVSYQGHTDYSLTAAVLPFGATSSIARTVSQYVRYEHNTTHSGIYAKIHWSPASLGGAEARAGVIRPQTEGGVDVSDGVYIAQSRGRVYEVIIASYGRPPAATLSRFPGVYRTILHTWHFL